MKSLPMLNLGSSHRALILVHQQTSFTAQMQQWNWAENYPSDKLFLCLLLGISLARWTAHACLDVPNPGQFLQGRSRIQFISLAVIRAKDACLDFSLAWTALQICSMLFLIRHFLSSIARMAMQIVCLCLFNCLDLQTFFFFK